MMHCPLSFTLPLTERDDADVVDTGNERNGGGGSDVVDTDNERNVGGGGGGGIFIILAVSLLRIKVKRRKSNHEY